MKWVKLIKHIKYYLGVKGLQDAAFSTNYFCIVITYHTTYFKMIVSQIKHNIGVKYYQYISYDNLLSFLLTTSYN